MGWAATHSVDDVIEEIISRLNGIANERQVDAQSLEQIRFTVQRLRSDPQSFADINAMIDCLRGDLAAVENWLSDVLKAPRDKVRMDIVQDFAVSLTDVGAADKAASLLEDWAGEFVDYDLLQRAVRLSIALGRLDLAARFERVLIGPEGLKEDPTPAEHMLATLNDRNLGSSDVADLMNFVHSELRSKGVRRVAASINICTPSSRLGPAVVARFAGPVTPAEAVGFEEELTCLARERGLPASKADGVLLMLTPVRHAPSISATAA